MRRLAPQIMFIVGLAVGLLPGVASADPDELIPCKRFYDEEYPHGRSGVDAITTFRCKPARGTTFALPSAAADPTVGGITLTINTVPPGNGTSSLAASGCVGLGRPAGSRGFKCVMEPLFHKVLIKPTEITVVVRTFVERILYDTRLPFVDGDGNDLDVAIILSTVGPSDTKRYCARFSVPPLENDASEYLGKNTPAPTACW